jgi:hypothetical protein
VIHPVPVIAKTSDWARKYAALKEPSYEMFAIAGKDRSWLLFDPNTKKFALASGTIEDGLELIGHSSDDALTEWRG